MSNCTIFDGLLSVYMADTVHLGELYTGRISWGRRYQRSYLNPPFVVGFFLLFLLFPVGIGKI